MKTNHMRRLTMMLTLVGILAVIAGCTEDRVDKKVLKYKVYEKGVIDTTALHLYVPSSMETSRKSDFSMAYQIGQERLVRMELGEFALNLYSVEREEALAGNPANDRLVMSIPVDHVDYRCQDDAFGECTGEETTNELIEWNKRKYFVPKLDETVFADPNFLPGEIPDDCYKETSKKLLSGDVISPDGLNFRLQRSFQTQLFFFCTRSINELEDLNWSDISNYSIVRLDKVATPDYKAAVYHPDWINNFGFFEQDDNRLDVDGNQTQEKETKYITRWNPNRTEVSYYLSKEFAKPEHAVLKAATIESFKRLNAGLKEAGVKFRLKLEQADDSVNVGDLRNSMIILAEDPFAQSVIGYGPAVTNPRTGEIISARTVMYLGSLKKFIRYTYDEILLEQKKQAAAPLGGGGDAPADGAGGGLLKQIASKELLKQQDIMKMLDLSHSIKIPTVQQVSRTPTLTEKDLERAAEMANTRDQIAFMAKNNMYPAELLEFGDISQEVIQEVVQTVGELKPWETLTDRQRQMVLEVLTPYVWVPTLIHEVGHNLGLRHNFSGSEDKANFYSQEELKAMNVPVSVKNVPYSSVMDYPKSEINALRALGKYDIAALKFGYAGKVDLADGSTITVDSSKVPAEGMKAYDYCSDEGIDPNPNCNPFDEGTGLKEIAQSLIDSYNESFERSNLRRGRANFSGMDDDMYFSRVNRTFRKLRLIFERYYDIVTENSLTQEDVDGIEFLKDMDEAVVLGADFLMDVVLQPDTLCVIATAEGAQVIPIDAVPAFAHGNTRDCSQIEFNEGVELIGTGGKPLNSIKLPSNPNRFADQIDIRGTALDKQIAMRTLFNRRLFSSLHDDLNSNYMDHPKVAPKLMTFVQRLLNNDVQGNVKLTFIDGSQETIPIGYSLADRSYEVRTSELPIVSRALGLPYDNLNLTESLTTIMRKGLRQGSTSPANTALQRDLTVSVVHPGIAGVVSLPVGARTLHVTPQNRIAFSLMKKLQRVRMYESATPESLAKIQDLLQNSKPLETLTDDERTIAKEGLEPLVEFLAGNATSAAYLEPILVDLAL